MKTTNNILTLAGSMLILSSVNAQVLTESFESGSVSAGWTQENIVGTDPWNIETTSAAYGGMGSGTAAAQDGLYYADLWNLAVNTNKLITPSMDLSAVSNPTVSFYYVTSGDLFGLGPSYIWDELMIYYKTSAGGSWTLIDTYSENHLGTNDWTSVTLSLPNPSSDYYIAFEGHENSTYSNGVHIDNIVVDGSGGGTILVTSVTVDGQGGASTITTAGGTLQMGSTVLPGNATDNTISWSVTNGTGSASINASGLLTAISDGTVTVTATANDASGETDDMVVTISNQSAGLAVINHNNFTIYPNPGSGIFQLDVSGINDVTGITVRSLMGQVVYTNDIVSNNLDLSNLPSGVYFVQVSADGREISKKLIIE